MVGCALMSGSAGRCIDLSMVAYPFPKLEKKKVFRLIDYLHDNYIYCADELDDIWYHDYRSTPSSGWYQQRRIMVLTAKQDTSGMYIHSKAIGKDGNLLLLAHTLKRY